MFSLRKTVLAALAFSLGSLVNQAQIIVDGGDISKTIPIAVTGYSGEAKSVLEFDLYIAGFDLVASSKAQFELTGKNEGQVEGALSDAANKAALFNRSYPGGSTRAQAHALADDVILAITGRKGISKSKVVYKVQKDRSSEIFASDFDGANPVQLTSDGSIVAAPAWRPGYRAIYYTSYRAGNADIYSHDLSSGARTPVVRFSGSNISPAPSPDGSKLAMILSQSGSPDLWVSDADGGNPKRLTTTVADESSPCWSPDGQTICFVSRDSGYAQLYTIPAAGGSMRKLTTSGVRTVTEPDWSPDGKWIAFTRSRGDYFDICIVASAGGDAKVITEGEDPSWSSNSRTLIIARRTGKYGPRKLSLLDWPTGHVKDAARVDGSSSQPNWNR